MHLTRSLACAAMVALSATASFAAPGQTLTVDGAQVSTDVRTFNGKAYVPVSDVAKYLKMTISHSAAGYAITTAGGAGQDNGARQGKVGDVIFTGKWRFSVLSVTTADEYQEVYYQEKNKIDPKSDGDTLLIVKCRLKNAKTEAQSPLLTERLPGNTAVADTSGQSYALIDTDARQDTDKIGSYAAATMLPGAYVDFALVFSIPKGSTPVAVVVTLGVYPDDVGGHGTDVRVKLN